MDGWMDAHREGECVRETDRETETHKPRQKKTDRQTESNFAIQTIK